MKVVRFLSLLGFIGFFVTIMFFVMFANVAESAEYTSVESIGVNDPDAARDFEIQGEYLNEDKSNNNVFGFNIIARGKGKFLFIVLSGGLSGDGWKRGELRLFANAEVKDGVLVVTDNEREELDDNKKIKRKKVEKPRVNRYKFANGKLTNLDKNEVLVKVNRKSNTLGLKVPDGGIQLFADGKASDILLNPKINTEAKTLWSEVSTKAFENRPYVLHVEFLTSYMPDKSGQGRSNSGVYIDECYECQILDSFGLEGLNNECGGFYQQAAPVLNMCYPPLQWQTYDIDFTPAKFDDGGKKIANARMTVKHNGVVIHENFEPRHETPGCKKETSEARGLYLQGHGNKVQFNNLWIKYKD
ncbi:MAG: DUF1080 domain-containing protein [Planctomycetaceae bacterium]|jgi:hypothetical protein|nr:DUF1080 domain-containing protein [Planctomycetaceae bacterium]